MYLSHANGHSSENIEYDLHGLVGIRLLNATRRDAAIVDRQLGPVRASLRREPDIVICFVDRLPSPTPVRYIGLDDAAFTDDAFLVLRGKHKSPARVQIAVEQIGQHCEIVCERGLQAVPLLIAIVNLTALAKGAVPLHASAFVHNAVGVLATGWAKGGKTETLLAFTARGAQYVGDEWIYIPADGREMYGIPEPIKVWYWHLQDLPQYSAGISRSDRLRLRGLDLFVRSIDRLTTARRGAQSLAVSTMRRVNSLLKQQLYVYVPPENLFGGEIGALRAPLDKVFFVASHESPDVTVQPMAPHEAARRMVFSLQHERLDLLAYYLKFRFAFPECRNELIERAEELQREILVRALADKETYAVYHPYPVPIPALYDAIRPYCTRSAQRAPADRHAATP